MIRKLSPKLISQIAAGEVVDRPLSVVKELVENSVDAGASVVDIEIINSGKDLIRVRDNGSGIAVSDLPLVFEKNATSKLREIEDLYRLKSLGFRGEALASIASVSRTELISRTESDEIGHILVQNPDGKPEISPIACDYGTVVSVSDLFYNIPVRYKFLKSGQVERSRIIRIVALMALANPSVSFYLTVDGKDIFKTPGKGNLLSTIGVIYGTEFAGSLIEFGNSINDIELSGYASRPDRSHATRNRQFIVVNGRVIESKLISDAADEAYEGLTMTRRYPAYIICLNLPPSMLDVNCHPQKLEVKFAREDMIYSLISNTIRASLLSRSGDLNDSKTLKADEVISSSEAVSSPINRGEAVSEANGKAVNEEILSQDERYLKQLMERINRKKQERELFEYEKPRVGNELRELELPSNLSEVEEIYSASAHAETPTASTVETGFDTEMPFFSSSAQTEDGNAGHDKRASNLTPPGVVKSENSAGTSAPVTADAKSLDFQNMKLIGQIFSTFILLEEGDSVYLIDQHAAHERVLFERFYNKFLKGEIVSQLLMTPISYRPDLGGEGDFEDVALELKKLGIEIEREDGDNWLIKSLPVFGEVISMDDFEYILLTYSKYRANPYHTNFIEKVIMRACKAAIKSGDVLCEEEIRELLGELKKCENSMTCPHGRPVTAKLGRSYFDRLFKRIV